MTLIVHWAPAAKVAGRAPHVLVWENTVLVMEIAEIVNEALPAFFQRRSGEVPLENLFSDENRRGARA